MLPSTIYASIYCLTSTNSAWYLPPKYYEGSICSLVLSAREYTALLVLLVHGISPLSTMKAVYARICNLMKSQAWAASRRHRRDTSKLCRCSDEVGRCRAGCQAVNTCMNIYIYIYIYTYVCISRAEYLFFGKCIDRLKFTHLKWHSKLGSLYRLHEYMYMYMCICICVYVYVYMYICICICICICMCI